jgi:hypothetical protein
MTKLTANRAKPEAEDFRGHPAVRNYTWFALSTLFLLLVCLVEDGLGWWCLLPTLIGVGTLLARWNLGPPLVIVTLTGLLLAPSRYRWGYPYWSRNRVPTLMDLVLCASVLAYVIAHYRLLSLTRHVLPTDPRRSRSGRFTDPSQRRSVAGVARSEMVLLVLSLPLWTALSVVAWGWLFDTQPPFQLSLESWRWLLVIWAALLVLGVTAIVAGSVRQSAATSQDSLLYLQEQLWRTTRREQSTQNRWLVWARWRAQRRKEA